MRKLNSRNPFRPSEAERLVRWVTKDAVSFKNPRDVAPYWSDSTSLLSPVISQSLCKALVEGHKSFVLRWGDTTTTKYTVENDRPE